MMQYKKIIMKEMLIQSAFPSTSYCIDVVNDTNAESYRRIRLREILLTLPQTSCGIERQNNYKMTDVIL